ncbi:hypothetical protein FKP32DRAFT_1604965 [Trametes sanguinea]|nr:hypothetical protein FKP32DRAFT_1604965 [Trametes sanguinea]
MLPLKESNALLDAHALSQKLGPLQCSEQDNVVRKLLDLSIICAQLATRYAIAAAPPDASTTSDDYDTLLEGYTLASAAICDYGDDKGSAEVGPSGSREDVSDANSETTSLPKESVDNLVSQLAPDLHRLLEPSLTAAVIGPLTASIQKELYPRLFLQLKNQLLNDLKAPMIDQLAPLLQEALLQFILGDDFEDFHDSAARLAATSLSVPTQDPLPRSPSPPAPSPKRPRFTNIQIVEGGCAHPDPLQALPSIWPEGMLAKKPGKPNQANPRKVHGSQSRTSKSLKGKGREYGEESREYRRG